MIDPRPLSVLLLAATPLLLPPPASAAEPCRDALREAGTSYAAGRIEEVEKLRPACLEGRASADERAQAWALLAKVYVVLEDDEAAAEAVAALLRLDPGYRPGRFDPAGFVRLLEAGQESRVTLRVGTVSKVDEPLREAPAAVLVVTAEEIERRGYTDLEELLHDLPGFDLSRGNGEVYSNVYMRGYRSDRSDRLLFLVDGVEQNDLHSNTAYISRQVPLSNIERVEVVYGPASTIYGANAFTGVISVTTKAPADLVGEGERVGVHARLASGSDATRILDATVAGHGPGGRLSWSLTGRSFRSDEPDLASFADWDYDLPASLDAVDYAEVLTLSGPAAAELADFAGAVCQGFCQVVRDGDVVSIEPTEAGVAAARELDRGLFDALRADPRLAGELAFRDDTDDWAVDAKLQVGDLELGFQTWRRDEGTTPWYTDLLRTGGGNRWTPKETAIYARYSHDLSATLTLSLFSRFKQHELDGDSRVGWLLTYGGGTLEILDLALLATPPSFQDIAFDQKSTQVRNELTVLYEPSRRFNLLAGLELRNTQVQVEFASRVTCLASADGLFGACTEGDGGEPRPIPIGRVIFTEQLADTKTDVTDLGIYVQATFKPRDDLKLVAGGRFDTSSLRGDEAVLLFRRTPPPLAPGQTEVIARRSVPLEGAGSIFNPRLAVVYTRGPFVWKAIYAEAFKEPSSLQRFTREPGVRQFSNRELENERMENLELHFGWQPKGEVAVDVVAYQADYSAAVGLQSRVNPFAIPRDSGRFANLGELRIRGLQATASWKLGRYDLWANYTYTDPRNVESIDEDGVPIPELSGVRIGDIARHRINLGAHATFGRRFDVDLRANWVGERRTGPGTTVPENPFSAVDAYLVTHATLGYEGLLPGATWQLVVRNLFDTDYEHPGVQRAGDGFASLLPQPGRSFLVRLSYRR